MTSYNARDIAEAYAQISEINPPMPAGGFYEINDLVLLRSVDPRQHHYLSLLSQTGVLSPRYDVELTPRWDAVRQAVMNQRKMREEL